MAVPAVIPLGIFPSRNEAPHFDEIPLERVEVSLAAAEATRGVSWVMRPCVQSVQRVDAGIVLKNVRAEESPLERRVVTA